MSSFDERLLTVNEVCQQLGISDRTLRRWRTQGILAAIKVRQTVRFRPSDVERALSGGATEIAMDSEA
jgi:excisionase family DNA binding protein